MAERPTVVVLTSHWGGDDREAAFVFRSLAGAASRFSDVRVLVPGLPGPPRADGAFDVEPIGSDPAGNGWPDPAGPRPSALDGPRAVLIDGSDTAARRLASNWAPDARQVLVCPSDEAPPPPDHAVACTFTDRHAARLRAAYEPLTPAICPLALHVPIAAAAAERRHNGLGFTGYVLVLSAAGGSARATDEPAPEVRWLAARFPRHHLVVIEDGVASVWQWRSLRGTIAVDTRMDFWRLLAHARVTVDLRPGPFVARECVESLRYGIPIVSPASSLGADHTAGGGGLSYADVAELLECVGKVCDEPASALSEAAQERAGQQFGDPNAEIEVLRKVVFAENDRRGR